MTDKITNNQISQSIEYKGSVKISLIKDGKVKKIIKTHNAGTKYLFQLLTTAITGESIANDIPQYIDILYSENPSSETPNFTSLLTYKPSITGTSRENTSVANKAIFTAYVPQSALKTTTRVFNKIAMYSKSNDESTEIAELILTEVTTIPDDYAVMIQWTMSFSNANS